jgi:AcrR family transcriptional regulator
MGREQQPGPIWARPEPGARRPRLSRGQIAAAALRIADREGFASVSMRRVAAELDAGTMSLYHYLRTKDDLIALMDDALMAEALIPAAELPTDWWEAMTLIARRTRVVLIRHPWALSSLQAAAFGPNAMRHFEQSLASVATTGLDAAAKFELLALVDDYVFGSALHTVEALRRAALAAADPEAVRVAIEFGMAQLRTGDLPEMAALMGDADPGTGIALSEGPPMGRERLDEQFERGLQTLLGGAAARYGLSGRVKGSEPSAASDRAAGRASR